MRYLVTLVFLIIGLCVAKSQPTIHVGSDIVLHGECQIAQDDISGGLLFVYGSVIDIDPSEEKTQELWYYLDAFINQSLVGYFPLDTKANSAEWIQPVFNGYVNIESTWRTNTLCLIQPIDRRKTINASITPFLNGDIWIDWARNGLLRLQSIKPKDFNRWLSNGLRNPDWK